VKNVSNTELTGVKIMLRADYFHYLQKHTIYQVITGSTAYGLNTETSDLDEKALVLLPAKDFFKLSNDWETETYHNPDIEFHSLKKAMKLFNSQNPTMLETLFIDEKFITKQTKIGQKLRDNRHLFLSQACYYTFGGYAKDQLNRIKVKLAKKDSRNSEQRFEENISRFVEAAEGKYVGFKAGNLKIDGFDKNNVPISLHVHAMPIMELNRFTSDLAKTIKQYNKNNVDTRDNLTKMYKHAMHVARLLLMGIEVLQAGTITVYQTEHQQLLRDIRSGKVEWDNFFSYTNDLLTLLDKAKQHSSLPERTNYKWVEELYYDLIREHYGISSEK
jgi:uncharacterized protein